MNPNVDYVKVVDLLADTVKELNVPCGEEAVPVPAERGAEGRRQDAADLLRSLLYELEQVDAGAAAEAEAANAAQTRKGPPRFSSYTSIGDRRIIDSERSWISEGLKWMVDDAKKREEIRSQCRHWRKPLPQTWGGVSFLW